VFHYVANVLKNVDLFDSRSVNKEDEMTGAIYNDFDSNPLDLLGGISSAPCYSQTSNLEVTADLDSDAEVAPKKAVEHALLEGDKHESIFVDFLSFESDLYDITTTEIDLPYMDKVYKIATVEDEEDFLQNIKIDDYVTDIYMMRLRNNWEGPDSVYDAWLLSHGHRRKWFPYSRFFRKYPDAQEKIKKMQKKYEEKAKATNDKEQPTCSKRKEPHSDLRSSPPKKYLTKREVEQFFETDKSSSDSD